MYSCRSWLIRAFLKAHTSATEISENDSVDFESLISNVLINVFLGVKDSSGLTFYYTEKLRKYDAGVFSVGVGVTPWFIIPPKQKNWISVGYCMHQCTEVSEDKRSSAFVLSSDPNVRDPQLKGIY